LGGGEGGRGGAHSVQAGVNRSAFLIAFLRFSVCKEIL
jgi:hypothetical protein